MLKRLMQLATRRQSLAAWTSIAAAGLNVVLMLAFTLILAPALDAAQFGAFSAVYAAGSIGSTIAAMGAPMLIQRMIPAYLAQEKWGGYRAILTFQRVAQIALLAISGISAASYFLVTDPTAKFGLAAAVVFFSAAIALGNISVSDIRCHGYNLWGTMLEKVVKPLLLVAAATYVALAASRDLGAAMAALMTATIAGSIGAFALTRFLKRPASAIAVGPDWGDRKLWTEIGLSGVFVAFLYLGINRLDLVVLGVVAPADTVGEYAIAQRITEMISLPAMALSGFITPMLSAGWAAGDKARVQRLIALTAVVSLAVGLSIAAALWFLAEPLFGFLGKTYHGGMALMAYVALGQIALAAVGPAGAAMVMTGHHRPYVAISVVVLILKASLVYLGWVFSGAQGAAIGSALTLFLMILLQAAVAYRLTGLAFGPVAGARAIFALTQPRGPVS
jgi:O-antigen/teichoic acid export membrane protein